MQILEGERDGLRAGAGQNPGGQRLKLFSPQLFGRECGGAVGRQGDVDQRRKQRGMFGGIEADQPQRVFEIGQALPGGRLSVAEALPSPFGDRVQGRVLQELGGRPFDPGVRRLAEAGSVLVTASVQRQTAGLFVAEELGARELKGVAAPVQLYRIVRASGGAGAASGR